ncbi:MAG TPA: DUF4157 domain-containing protein [Pyrinomonadaceae bacterium]
MESLTRRAQSPAGGLLVRRPRGEGDAGRGAEGRGARPDESAAPRLAHDFGRVSVRPAAAPPPVLQAKLTVGARGDAYEQEADRVAERVADKREPRRECACGGECPACGGVRGAGGLLQTKPAASNDPAGSPAPPVGQVVLRAPGQPLDASTRAFMEPRFGYDFARVRVHADERAAESARAVNALAYTVGRHVVFGAGRYAPWGGEGRRLLAHELAHVVQQGGGGGERLSRVPDESGARKGRYSFSANCGWIDWDHADPGLTGNMIRRVRKASDALAAAAAGGAPATGELTSPIMTSTLPVVGTVLSSASVNVRLLRPLSADEVLGVALSIFKRLSLVFEVQQEWTDAIGHSSFSQEDLPSNLIGFYRAARGYSREQVRQFCAAASAEGSVNEYKRNHDFRQNRSFAPVGATGPWPAELSNIDDTTASALYEITKISATQGGESASYCPMYRVVGTIGEDESGNGGKTFAAADNLRVVPTYRSEVRATIGQAPTRMIEVEPNSQPDFHTFAHHGLKSPLYAPEHALVCLSSHGKPL